MRKPKIGLLPLYIELYDRIWPECRPRFETYYQEVSSAIRARGAEVTTAPFCRLKAEFKAAVSSLEKADVDALVTLHLAYSPSLESADVLAATRLPIIVLDTTPTYGFGPQQAAEEMMYNHGIHGVQDMCNLLLRSAKTFQIEVGHWQNSDVLDRVVAWVQAARLVTALGRARVGRIGPPFVGMGDFAVPGTTLKRKLGITTVVAKPKQLAAFSNSLDKAAIEAEMAADRERFATENIDGEAHRRSVRAGLAVRRWIEQEKLTAMTINFMEVRQATGLPTMPFLEASKAMARGIGYAGEGDVLTAALVGALASVYPDTSFTEMFCPDWENDLIFLSHMGEMNVNLTAGRAKLLVKPFPFTDVGDPVVAAGRFRGGESVLVNLAPLPKHKYNLLVAPVMMHDVTGPDNMAELIHGWFKPALPLQEFLAEYSRAGGTHHSALVYGGVAEEIARFGKLMNWHTVLLK